jgi:hypothetical protein
MEVAGKSLHSYLAKTTMYWLCEEIEPELWTDENLVSNLQKLLQKLFGFLDAGHVPNYFVPAIDLLGNVPNRLLTKVQAMDRSKLLDDPIRCLPTCFRKVSTSLDFVRRVFVKSAVFYRGKINRGRTLSCCVNL